MDQLALAAPAAVVGASLVLVVARRRVALMAGVVVALLVLPVAGRVLPTTAGWGFAAGAHLVATLLGGLILLIGFRPLGARLVGVRWFVTVAWLFAVIVAAVAGVVFWPEVRGALEPARVIPARVPNQDALAEYIDPMRWALGAGLAVLVAAARQWLAPEPTRLAAAAALFVAGVWLIGISVASPLPDLSLVAVSAVLPIAAAAAAWRTVRAPRGGVAVVSVATKAEAEAQQSVVAESPIEAKPSVDAERSRYARPSVEAELAAAADQSTDSAEPT